MSPSPAQRTGAPSRTALVSGANRGIGLAVARALAESGVSVLLASRIAEPGREAAAALAAEGLDVRAVALDVADSASIGALADRLSRERVHVDVLVNNAAVFLDQRVDLLDVSRDTLRRTLEVNTLGALELIQRFAPAMRDRGWGRIVNVSSDMGQLENQRRADSAYRLSKLALNGVTLQAADALRGTGVLVNAVHPGWVRTRMGGEGARLSEEEGADTVVWAALLPEGSPTGVLFRRRTPIAW